MPHLFSASALAAALAAASATLADLVTLNQAPAVPSPGLDWRNLPNGYRFLPPIGGSASHPGDASSLTLLDTVLLASVDGRLHALNRTSGAELWSMSSPTIQNASMSSILGPLIKTKHAESDQSSGGDDEDEDISSNPETYVIEPQSGDIFIMSTPSGPLQRLPFSVPQLVHLSPFQFTDGDNTRLFVGKKETSLLLVELETGRIKRTISSECPWDPAAELKKAKGVDLDELEADEPPRISSSEVYIGRTDYHVIIETEHADPTSPNPPTQSLTFSTYGPNNQDLSLQTQYRRTADDAYVQPHSNGAVMSFKARPLDPDDKTSRKPEPMWSRQFSDTIVAVFDVVKTPGRRQPFVLTQPHARLEEVFPHVDIQSAARENKLPNLDSAYIGMVKQTGSLYAMTPDSFPLLLFGGFEAGVDSRYLIDAPPGTVMDFIPDEIDEVTRQRRLRELCKAGSTDKRCFTGIRRLEEDSSRSRYSRLIEGSPYVEDKPVPEQIVEHTDKIAPVSNVSLTLPWIGKTFPPGEGLLIGASFGLSLAMPIVLSAILVVAWFIWKSKKNRRRKDRITDTPSLSPKESPVSDKSTNGNSLHSLDSSTSKGTAGPVSLDRIVSSADAPSELPSTPRPEDSPVTSQKELAGDSNDAEDSDKEDDPTATPGKRKTRRGRRAKKKKVVIAAPADADEEGTEKVNDEKLPNSVAVPPTPAPLTPSLVISSPPPAAVQPSLIVSNTILGFGSHGTVVFEGSLQGRSVAVKRLLQDFVTLASREVSILQESDDHPNVIRYYYQETHANFLYIALELCPASLADIVENPDQYRELSVNFEPKRALQQITSGLRHLHALKLVHRDIKPQNILVSGAKNKSGRGGLRMLISDFGLCKRLETDQTSFLPTAHGAMAAGTVGWRAPEILRGEVSLLDAPGDDLSQSSRGSVSGSSSANGTVKPTRLTKSVDIFALGCLFYYTLTNGGHPYGDRFEREVNIIKNAKCLDGLERFGEEGSEAVDLISRMLDFEAKLRPDTTTCLLHPFFWDPGRRLNFLQEASDRFEIMCRDPVDPNLVTLETNAAIIVGSDWYARLDKVFIENLGKFRKYDSRSVRDLLRALRNKKHHYQDLPDNVKRSLGPMPEGFLTYFTRRFPALFLHVHDVVSSTNLRQESMFRSYFELPD